MKVWVHTRRHFTSGVCERAIPTSTIKGCYPMLIRQRECHSHYRDVHYYVIICPVHCLLIGYDASRRDERMNMFIFRRSRIEGESKSNRNCNSRLSQCHKNCKVCRERSPASLCRLLIKISSHFEEITCYVTGCFRLTLYSGMYMDWKTCDSSNNNC